MNFKKYSLITGAAGFLGKMHAEALLEQGDNVIITDLKKNSLSRLKKKLADIFNESEIIAEELNVTSENSIKELIKKLKKKNILVNVLINNAIIDHKFKSGQKVIHTATIPAIGLENNKEYFIFVVDTNNIRLTNTYYDSINAKPNIVGITSASNGTLSNINPPIQVYKDSSVIFDLSDSSLSYTQQSTLYPAFDLKFFNDSNLTKNYNSNSDGRVFEVQKVGTVGVTSDAKIILSVNESTPENLYYNLISIYDGNLPENKKLISEDHEVLSNNEIQVLNITENMLLQ